MANKKFWLVMLVIILALGMTAVGCEDDSSGSGSSGGGSSGNGNSSSGGSGSGGSNETIYDPTGIWDFNINGQPATVTVSGNNYTFSGAGQTDAGTFTKSGNVATLYTSTPGWNNAKMGTATMTSNTTMTLNLISPSYITGVFAGAKRL